MCQYGLFSGNFNLSIEKKCFGRIHFISGVRNPYNLILLKLYALITLINLVKKEEI